MKCTLAYKYKLKTDTSSNHKLVEFAGANRYIWNKILGLQKERYLEEW